MVQRDILGTIFQICNLEINRLPFRQKGEMAAQKTCASHQVGVCADMFVQSLKQDS